jgi:hypothetical protein
MDFVQSQQKGGLKYYEIKWQDTLAITPKTHVLTPREAKECRDKSRGILIKVVI